MARNSVHGPYTFSFPKYIDGVACHFFANLALAGTAVYPVLLCKLAMTSADIIKIKKIDLAMQSTELKGKEKVCRSTLGMKVCIVHAPLQKL